MKSLQSIIVRYEDGSERTIDVAEASRVIELLLATVGLGGLMWPLQGHSAGYVLVCWEDGWKEVFGVRGERLELLRYYVLERTEQVGRLVLETGEAYPNLVYLRRKPFEVSYVGLVGEWGGVVYRLEKSLQLREGDKLEQHYEALRSDSYAHVWKDLMGALKEALRDYGLDGGNLLVKPWGERIRVYEEVARKLGVVPGERGSDVYGFIESLIRMLEAGRM